MSEFEIKTNVVTEEWISRKWRPAMGWMYMVVCIFDFIIFPILWSLLQSFLDGEVKDQWDPLTLQGAGLFHLAMGAVLGIAAYGRTKEKLSGVITPSMIVTDTQSVIESNDYGYGYSDSDYQPITQQPQVRRVRRSFANNASPIPQNLMEGNEE